MRGQRRRKERWSTAYFFVAGLERDFAFGLGTLSSGVLGLAVFGFWAGPFVLVFFGMISSCLGRRQNRSPGLNVDRGVAYKATAETAMQVNRQRKNGRSRCDAHG